MVLHSSIINKFNDMLDVNRNSPNINDFSYSTLYVNCGPLVFNTIIFLIFIIVDFLLPVKLVIKFLFIGIALICHPVIDYLEIENVLVTNVIIEMIEDTKKLLKK